MDINENGLGFFYLLQVIDIVSCLEVQLEDIEDSPVDIQHGCRDTSRRIEFTDNAVGILKLDGIQKLSMEG